MKDRRSPSLARHRGPTRTDLGIPSLARRARNLTVCLQKQGYTDTTRIYSTFSIADHLKTILTHLKARRLSARAGQALKRNYRRSIDWEFARWFRLGRSLPALWALKQAGIADQIRVLRAIDRCSGRYRPTLPS